jgi:hypothetical protein
MLGPQPHGAIADGPSGARSGGAGATVKPATPNGLERDTHGKHPTQRISFLGCYRCSSRHFPEHSPLHLPRAEPQLSGGFWHVP